MTESDADALGLSSQYPQGQMTDSALFVPQQVDGSIGLASFQNAIQDGFEVGEFRLVRYSAFWADAIYATSRTNPGAFTLWVFSEQTQGEPAFVVDARRSRFGLDIDGPEIPQLVLQHRPVGASDRTDGSARGVLHGGEPGHIPRGIGQGVCPCLRAPIRSIGGWIDVWHNWSPSCRSHVGYGLDDPRNNDSLFGRTYNQFLFANFSYDVTKYLTTGFEVTWWTTFYQDRRAGQIPDDQLMPTAPGEAVVLQWMFKYGF